MAGRWRIRHKLMLGLGLVIAVMGLLLAGTVHGLVSYRRSSGMVESKVRELAKAQRFKARVTTLALHDAHLQVHSDGYRREVAVLTERLGEVRAALAEYRAEFEDTVRRQRYLRKERHMPGLLDDIGRSLGDMDKELREAEKQVEGWTEGKPPPLRTQDPLAGRITRLEEDANDLEQIIYKSLDEIREHAKDESQTCLWVVGVTSSLSVLLMAGLLRFYYGWTFNPVRDLMLGVARVARGDFGHAIVVNSGDEMQDLAAAFNDMTGRLRDMYRDLERQVNERSRQLVRSERLASVGFLAAGVAHEINNPLASIAFCSEALEARLKEMLGPGPRRAGDAEVVYKYLRMVQEEAFRCKEITQRLLEFSRGGERRREPTDLGELIGSVLDVTRHLQNHKGKAIVFDPSAKVVARVNAQEIKSVVLNLVVNALESMDEDGRLTVGLRQRDGYAEMTFADTGCGMTAEVLENIFEPFFTHSRTGKGTGLGLTITHRVVTGHGGDIEATSAGPGRGSTFAVRLPLRPADDGTKDAEDLESPEALFRRRQAA